MRCVISQITESALVFAVLTIVLSGPLATDVLAAEALTGSKPWVTILCRFADSTSVTPHPKSYYAGLMGSSYPGMDHYWRELSYNTIDLTGSIVVGWYDLPHEESYYLTERGGTIQYDYDRTFNDCTAAAEKDVPLSAYTGIILIFNQPLCCANGAFVPLTRDGQAKVYGVIWLPSSHQTHAILAHEMGHAFGLPHSSGSYGQTYDNGWDVMSGTGGPRCVPHPDYGCPGQHTISYHKDLLGWIPASRKYAANPGTSETILLERLALPASSGGYLMARVPIVSSTAQFYTVEARRFSGYDMSGIPGEAIVIHRVDETIVPPPGLPSVPRAFVVDPDNNGDPNDAGAMWLPGETFTDVTNAITVSVIGTTSSGWQVTITNAAAPQLSLVASVNQLTFAVGQTLTATAGLTNPGLTGSADLYLGVLLPDGATIVFFTDTGDIAVGRVTDLGSFRPYKREMPLAGAFSTTMPNFFSYQWTGTEPRGHYLFFHLAMQAGPLASGSVTTAQVLGLATALFFLP